MVQGAKKVALMCLGLAAQKHADKLENQQELLGLFADIAMDVYALESALLRTQKRAAREGEAKAALQAAAVQCYAQEAMDRVEANGRKILASLDEGDMLRTYLAALKRFTKRGAVDTIGLKRQIAEAAIDRVGAYPLADRRWPDLSARAARDLETGPRSAADPESEEARVKSGNLPVRTSD